jgi:acetyltransferase
LGDVERHDRRQDRALIPEDLDESFQPVIGAPVTIRPLRPDDVGIEREFVTGLSDETRYSRLLGGAIKVTDEYIRRLTHLDWSREVALAAITMLGDAETIIGVARYVIDGSGEACEFAIVIADAWQGRGIGRRMLLKLVSVARRRGLKRIYGDILSTNHAMLGMARRLGFHIERHPGDSTIARATLELGAAAS